MGKIVQLDDLTINKIAAGEVIERPASVIKELVENSIDAGATNITIEIRNGGISYIRITDNGSGIQRDDMEIAFERHATSKIRSADDLSTVKSNGFRGEALASIAAISNIELTSKTPFSNVGYKVNVEGGKVLAVTEVGCPVGTTIVVRNLFFNTPVRYKFLKKDYTESGYIEDVVTKLVLANPGVAIRFVNTGKNVIQTQGNNDLKSIIYSIYGKDVANGIVDVNYDYNGMKVTGVVGKPEIARSNRTNQIFFVNNRNVKDKTLTAAIEQAYKGTLPAGKFAFSILNLEMDPAKVDVNVHPAKLEVRFAEESQVFKAIYNAVKDSFVNSNLAKEINNTFANVFEEQDNDEKIENENEEQNISNEYKDYKELKEHKESKGIAGFIKKIYKNQVEETEDELNNNNLKEIYEFRKELKKIGVEPVSAAPIDISKAEFENTQELQQNTIQEQEQKQEVDEIVGDQNMDDFIKQTNEKTKRIIESYYNSNSRLQNHYNYIEKAKEKISDNEEYKPDYSYLIEKKNELENNIKEENEKNVNSVQEITYQEEINNTKIQDNANMNKENTTQKLDLLQESVMKEINAVAEKNSENSNYIEENIDFNNRSNIAVEQKVNDGAKTDNVTQKLMENIAPISDADRTQIIDTIKIREAIKEVKDGKSSSFDEMYSKIFGRPKYSNANENEEKNEDDNIEKIELSDNSENLTLFDEKNSTIDPIKYKYIGVAFDNYIMVEIKDDMYIINKMLACERIIYEKIRYTYSINSTDEAQMLLVPDVVALTEKQADILKQNLKIFEQAGFSMQEFGENTIKLTGVPNICINLNTKQLVIDLIDAIDTVPVNSVEEIEEKFLTTIAMKIAEEESNKLNEEDINKLLIDLFKFPDPFELSQGISIATRITKVDLEKRFSRRK